MTKSSIMTSMLAVTASGSVIGLCVVDALESGPWGTGIVAGMGVLLTVLVRWIVNRQEAREKWIMERQDAMHQANAAREAAREAREEKRAEAFSSLVVSLQTMVMQLQNLTQGQREAEEGREAAVKQVMAGLHDIPGQVVARMLQQPQFQKRT